MAVTTERMTAGDPPGGQPETPYHTVGLDRLGGVGGTGRQIATGRGLQRSILLVPIQCALHQPPDHRLPIPGGAGDETRDIVAKCCIADICGGSIVDTEQVQARAQLDLVGQDGPQATADPIPHHRIPEASTNRIPNMG